MVSFQDVNPETRLGSSAGSLAALKAHPFFAGIDWRNVRGQSAPPLLPAPAVDEDDEDGEVNCSALLCPPITHFSE
jgi:3-phosphoinositide dependent protein kinase-1